MEIFIAGNHTTGCSHGLMKQIFKTNGIKCGTSLITLLTYTYPEFCCTSAQNMSEYLDENIVY